MKRRNYPAGFSLTEVVLAVAIAGGALVTILGLLASLTGQAARQADMQVAARLPDAVLIELTKMGRQQGLAALAALASPLSGAEGQGLRLVAGHDGTGMRRFESDEALWRDAYFLIEARRFPLAPLAYEPGSAVLPLNVRVAWPYRPAGSGSVVPAAERRVVDFNLAIGP